MNDLAKNLMRVRVRGSQTNTPSAIFGSVGSMAQSISSRPSYRIGMWPCISDSEPDVGLGLWSALAHLLERWRDIQVYRLFTRLEGDPGEFDWSIDQSQFGADDWYVEGLDDNVAIWGTLAEVEGKWELSAFVEDNSMDDEQDSQQFSIVVEQLEDLIDKLPELAEWIAKTIGASRLDEAAPIYTVGSAHDSDTLEMFFESLARWDVTLLAVLWGYEWDDTEVVGDYEELLDAAQKLGTDFAAWALSQTVAQSMLPGYSVIGDLLTNKVTYLVEALPNSRQPAIILSAALHSMGLPEEAYNILLEEVGEQPESVETWLRLAELYAVGGRLEESIDTFQSAIEKEAVNGISYRAYGNLLTIVDQRGLELEAVVLADPDEIEDDEDTALWEAIESYKSALELAPDDIPALYAQLLQLAQIEQIDDYFWTQFERLVSLSESGEQVRDVIDSLFEVEDNTAGIAAIDKFIKEMPERVDLYINAAALHLASLEDGGAMFYLEKAQKLAESIDVKADVERLILTVEDEEFEQRLGDISAVLEAGNSVSADDVDFLEAVSEKAPNLLAIHILLARAYDAWGDGDAASDVLLNADKVFPTNPDILDLLARILYDADEQELAFKYLNKGIAAFPHHVPLLVRTGRYLFDNGQLDHARAYLSHAEEVAPNHPNLRGVRAYIAREMSRNPQKPKGDD